MQRLMQRFFLRETLNTLNSLPSPKGDENSNLLPRVAVYHGSWHQAIDNNLALFKLVTLKTYTGHTLNY